MRDATEELRGEMDSASEFFEDRLEYGKYYTATPAQLQTAYTAWADSMSIPAARRLGQKRIAKKVKSRGCVSAKDSTGNRFWSGVGVKV